MNFDRVNAITSDLKASHQADVARLAKLAPPVGPPETLLGCALRVGVRVLDQVTGLEGDVVATTIKHNLVPASSGVSSRGSNRAAQ